MKKAFTLLEIILVLSIIAVLLSIILPSFRGVQDESSIAKATTDLAMLQTVLESYYTKNSTFPQDVYTYQNELINQTRLLTQELYDPFLVSKNVYEYHVYSGNAGRMFYLIVSPGLNRQVDLALGSSGGDIDLNQGTVTIREGVDDYLVTNLKKVQ